MFPTRLKKLREDKSWTQLQLSKKIDVSPKTIGAWERGTREPPMDTIAKFAEIFSVSTDYLLGESDIKNPSTQKEVDIADNDVIKTFEGKPIPEEDLELIKRLLRGKE